MWMIHPSPWMTRREELSWRWDRFARLFIPGTCKHCPGTRGRHKFGCSAGGKKQVRLSLIAAKEVIHDSWDRGPVVPNSVLRRDPEDG